MAGAISASNLLDCQRCLECVNDHLATRPVQKEDWEGYSSEDDEDETEYGSELGSNPYESYVRTRMLRSRSRSNLTANGDV